MDIIRSSQLALGIREDIPNIFDTSLDHPFVAFLTSELLEIRREVIDIPTDDLKLSSEFEHLVDKFIDKIGTELYNKIHPKNCKDLDCGEPHEGAQSWPFSEPNPISARSLLLVDAKKNNLGGHYPKNLFWSVKTHEDKIRLEFRQLIACEFNLGLVYKSIEPKDPQAKQEGKSPTGGDTQEETLGTSSLGTSKDESANMQPSFHRNDVNGKHVNINRDVADQLRPRTRQPTAASTPYAMDLAYEVGGTSGSMVPPQSSSPPVGLPRGQLSEQGWYQAPPAPMYFPQHDLDAAKQHGHLPDSLSSNGDRHDSAAVLTEATGSPKTALTLGHEQVGDSVEVIDLTGDDPDMPQKAPVQASTSLTPLVYHAEDIRHVKQETVEDQGGDLRSEPSRMLELGYGSKRQGKRPAGSAVDVQGTPKRPKTVANGNSTSFALQSDQDVIDRKPNITAPETSAESVRPDTEAAPEQFNGSYSEGSALKDTPEATDQVHGQESGPPAPRKPASWSQRSEMHLTGPGEHEEALPRRASDDDSKRTMERAATSSSSDNAVTTVDPFKDVLAKAYFRPDCPDIVYLSGCSTAADLFAELEDIKKSHYKLSDWTVSAIRVRIGAGEQFRIGQSKHGERGFWALVKAVETKRDEEEVLLDPELKSM